MANIYDLADTWNNGATVFDAIAINVTDTASNSESKLLDLQVGGTSQFRVRKDGKLTIGEGDEAVELFYRGSAAAGISVPVFRAAGVDTPTALDVFPNGAGNDATGKAWIHVLGQDLTDTPAALSARWQAALVSIRTDGMTFGAHRGGYNVTVTGGSGTGTTVTLTFAAQVEAPFAVGDEIEVTGVTPTQFNGNHIVTACTTTSVSYSSTQTAYTSGGTIRLSNLRVTFSGREFNFRDAIAGASGTNFLTFGSGGAYYGGTASPYVWLNQSDVRFKSNYAIRWMSNSSNVYGTNDVTLQRAADSILKLSRAGSTLGAAFEFFEMTAPSTPAANSCRVYSKDNGAGKTQLVVLMPDGVETVIATET